MKQLLEQHSHLFIKDALFFIGIHEEYLTDCILLAKSSLEPNAMKLIKITLELISAVVTFEGNWKIDYFQSVMTLMVSFIYKTEEFILTDVHSTEMRSKFVRHISLTASSSKDT